jgi:hypothetical protein
MMRFTGIVFALAMQVPPEISVYDSKTKPGYSWILVNDCPVEVKTSEFKNPDKVVAKVNAVCGLELDLYSVVQGQIVKEQ